MKCFKRISALIIAGVIGITNMYSSVPVYALDGGDTSYYVISSGLVSILEKGITIQEGAILETEDSIKTIIPEVVTETVTPGVIIETKEPAVAPIATLPVTDSKPMKTDTPVLTSSPITSSFPIMSNIPSDTISPIKTKTPDKTNIPVLTPIVKETVLPVWTEEVNKTSSPIKTLPPITEEPIKTQLPSDATAKPENNNSSTITTTKPDTNVSEEYCRITYQLNGGINHKNNPSKVKKRGVSVVLNTPSKAKYTFVGWYTDAKYTNKVTTVGNTSLSFLTLYAKWKKVRVKQVVLSYAKKKGANSILVKVKKESGVLGFEYVYAKDLYFKRKYRLRTQKNPKTLSKLNKKKIYYIKVRAYKLDSTGKKIYGIYSRIKKVKL